MVVKYGGAWWISIVGTIFVLTFTIYLWVRLKMLIRVSSDTDVTELPEIPVVSRDWGFGKKAKPKIEVGRDESITINVHQPGSKGTQVVRDHKL